MHIIEMQIIIHELLHPPPPHEQLNFTDIVIVPSWHKTGKTKVSGGNILYQHYIQYKCIVPRIHHSDPIITKTSN